ncbi:MAG TPA: DUF433 domain-containing protein [Blastocatellia bacterium]
MVALDVLYTFPLVRNRDGVIMIAGTRVPLDLIVHHFKLGATPEQVAHKFPTVGLADIYSAITYYLTHQEQVETYLIEQDRESERTRAEIADVVAGRGIRERLLARRSSGS